MNKIIVASHGGLAGGLLDAARLIVGTTEDVFAFGLMPEEKPEDFKERLYKEIDSDPDRGVLVLLDILCGTPFNSVIEKLRQSNVQVVIGVNLPMLLESILHQGDELEALSAYVEETGHQGITSKHALMEKLKKKEGRDEH